MKGETGLDITNPKLVGIKQFPITNGRYIVLLFKATDFCGTVISSDEGDMEWIDIDDLSKVNVVEDLPDCSYASVRLTLPGIRCSQAPALSFRYS